MLGPSSTSSSRAAKVLWGRSLQVRTSRQGQTIRRKCPFPRREVLRILHGEKRAEFNLFFFRGVARFPEFRRHHLPDQKTNPRPLPPCCQGRHRPGRHRVQAPSSDDFQTWRAVICSSPSRKRLSNDLSIRQVSRCSRSLTPVMMGKTMKKALVRVRMQRRTLISPKKGVRVQRDEGKGRDCCH